MLSTERIQMMRQVYVEQAARYLAVKNWLLRNGFKEAAEAVDKKYKEHRRIAEIISEILAEKNEWSVFLAIEEQAEHILL